MQVMAPVQQHTNGLKCVTRACYNNLKQSEQQLEFIKRKHVKKIKIQGCFNNSTLLRLPN